MAYCSATAEIMYAALDFAFAIAGTLLSDLRPHLGARIFGVQRGQLPKELAGALVARLGSLDGYLHNLVAAGAGARTLHALFAQPEALAVLGALRNLEQGA